MRKILVAVSLFAFSVSAYAEDFSRGGALRAFNFSLSSSESIQVPLPNLPERVDLPGKSYLKTQFYKSAETGWEEMKFSRDLAGIPSLPMTKSASNDSAWPLYTDSELYFYGGVSFEYKGSTISVKMGFKKGHYEPYVKNYKTKPVLIVAEVTGIVISSDSIVRFPMVMDILSSDGENKATYILWKDGRYQNLEFKFNKYGSTVEVFTTDETTDKREPLLDLRLSILLQAWAENAKRYAMPYDDKIIYVVQQLLPWERYDAIAGPKDIFGWVLSESSPLYHTTGLPLDFVELYRCSSISTDMCEYKPITYSIPLGIALEKSELGPSWNMRDMTKDELKAAINEEINDTQPKN